MRKPPKRAYSLPRDNVLYALHSRLAQVHQNRVWDAFNRAREKTAFLISMLPPAMFDDHDDRAIVWFDIDNTLYSASTRISDAMGERIHAYFVTLGLTDDEASELHMAYYTQYGLALRGLVHHHNIDPLDFNDRCDGSLPLESMIKPDPSVRKLFQDVDRTKVRVWALTNAYVTHAQRVLRILNVEDLVEGLVYCDYAQPNFVCKPETTFYYDALAKANVKDPSKCYFVDDSRKNVDTARSLGWGHCVHFCEQGLEVTEGGQKRRLKLEDPIEIKKQETGDEVAVVTSLQQLRNIWPQIFL